MSWLFKSEDITSDPMSVPLGGQVFNPGCVEDPVETWQSSCKDYDEKKKKKEEEETAKHEKEMTQKRESNYSENKTILRRERDSYWKREMDYQYELEKKERKRREREEYLRRRKQQEEDDLLEARMEFARAREHMRELESKAKAARDYESEVSSKEYAELSQHNSHYFGGIEGLEHEVTPRQKRTRVQKATDAVLRMLF